MTTIRTVTQKKAGHKPNPIVARELRRRFPSVRLWWATDVKRWALVQVWPGQMPWLIRVLKGQRGEYVAPTLRNTVHHLDSIHPSRFTHWAAQRFLNELDESERLLGVAKEREQEPLRREIADRVYSAMHPKAIVTVRK